MNLLLQKLRKQRQYAQQIRDKYDASNAMFPIAQNAPKTGSAPSDDFAWVARGGLVFFCACVLLRIGVLLFS